MIELRDPSRECGAAVDALLCEENHQETEQAMEGLRLMGKLLNQLVEFFKIEINSTGIIALTLLFLKSSKRKGLLIK